MKQVIKELAEVLDNAAKDSTPIAQLSLKHTISLSDAYDIQKASIDRRYDRGENPTGLKLGFTSRAKMEQMGVHDLIWGRLTDKMAIENGGNLTLSEYVHPRAEPEIAFLLKDDIAGLITLDNATDHISGVAAAIEIIDSRYENFKFSLEDVVADNCSSSAYILGDWHEATTNVADLHIELKVNGEVIQSGNSNAILGNPLESLVEAVRLANENNVSLKKGMIILAGAATPAVFLKNDDQVEVNVADLGTVRLNVV